MKRIFVIFICVTLLFGLCAPVAGNRQVGYRTVTIKDYGYWSTVSVCAKKPGEPGSYPGRQLQKTGNVYKLTIKSEMLHLVITGASTDNVTSRRYDVYLENNENNVTVDIQPGREPVLRYDTGTSVQVTNHFYDYGLQSIFRVSGSADWMGYWKPDNDQGLMHEVATGIFRKTFYDVGPGTYDLQITKNGSWRNSFGVDGKNYTFRVEQLCNVAVELILKNGVGQICVYGLGNSSDSMLAKPLVLGINSAPDPLHDPTSLWQNPIFGTGYLLTFLVLTVCVYQWYLLAKRRNVTAAVTPEGRVYQRAPLSQKTVAEAVKHNMPMPPPELDRAILEAVHKAKKTSDA